MVLHKIFSGFAPYTVLLQQGREQHAPCVPLKAGIGKESFVASREAQQFPRPAGDFVQVPVIGDLLAQR